MWRGYCAGVVTGLCLGTVQLLVFACYASSFWLGAYLVQEELIQAGQFVAVSDWLIPCTDQTGGCCYGYRCSLQYCWWVCLLDKLYLMFRDWLLQKQLLGHCKSLLLGYVVCESHSQALAPLEWEKVW